MAKAKSATKATSRSRAAAKPKASKPDKAKPAPKANARSRAKPRFDANPKVPKPDKAKPKAAKPDKAKPKAAKPGKLAIDVGAVIAQLLAGDQDQQAEASHQLDKAARKDKAVAEQVVAACFARPDSMDADVVMVRFAELAINDNKLENDPRTLALLRRQLTVKPVGVSADELSAQEMAVATLVSIKDRESLPAIVGLLAQEPRESLWFNICDAVATLGGGKAELAALQAALPRANDSEAFEVERLIEKLAKRLR